MRFVVPTEETKARLGKDLLALLQDAPATPRREVGVACLLVFDGIEAGPGFLERCTQQAQQWLAALQDVSARAGTGVFQNLTVDLWMRLPLLSGALPNRGLQEQWLREMRQALMVIPGSLASVRRIWWTAASNVDPEGHPEGRNLARVEDYDAVLAEGIVLWLQADLEPELAVGQAPVGPSSTPHASLGCARLVFESRRLREERSQRFAREFLPGVADAHSGMRRIPATDSERFVSEDLPLAEGMRGLKVETTLNLLRRPSLLNEAFPGSVQLQDLKGLIRKVRPPVEADLEERPFETAGNTVPARVMERAYRLLADDLFAVVREVRQARHRLFEQAVRELEGEIARRLEDGSVSYLAQLDQALWDRRAWMERERGRVEDVAREAFAEEQPAPETPTGWWGRLKELFSRPEGRFGLVPEEEPNPVTYHDRLVALLKVRPLPEAWITRTFLAAIPVGMALSLATRWIAPEVASLPFLGSPLTGMAVVLAAWTGLSLKRLATLRRKRQRALEALYIALERHGRILIRNHLIRSLKRLYQDVAATLALPRNPEVSAEALAGIRESLTECRPWSEGLRRALTLKDDPEATEPGFVPLAERLQSLINAVKESAERIGADLPGEAFVPGPVVDSLVNAEDAASFPFLTKAAPAAIEPADQPSREEMLRLWMQSGIARKAWEDLATNRKTAVDALAESTRSWAFETGFRYLEDTDLERIVAFLVRHRGATVDRWRSFLERGAFPFCPLGENGRLLPLRRLHLTWPGSVGDQLGVVLQAYPKVLPPQWGGAPSIVATCLQGPGGDASLPALPLDFPSPGSEDSGVVL
ncbi:hypothetical protein KBD49_00065 [Myxococcota bacterium]|nr:hypothetical protein [Myxococcota bacterium]